MNYLRIYFRQPGGRRDGGVLMAAIVIVGIVAAALDLVDLAGETVRGRRDAL